MLLDRIAFLLSALLILLQPAASFSRFGHPWAGNVGFDGFHGPAPRKRSPVFHDYDNGYDANYYDDYFGRWNHAPCPRYEPLRVSASPNQLMFEVSLPGVKQQDMSAWLSDDSSAIHVQGLRALPTRGRACLPAEAKVSSSGRYEILEALIPVPVHGDYHRTTMRKIQGGLRISMPQRVKSRIPASSVASKLAHTGVPRDSDFRSGFRQTTGQTAGAQPLEATHSVARERRTPALRTHAQLKMRRRINLPPSTGIHVEDADFPWPEKSYDASAGWYDNRGDFQPY